MEVEPCGTFPKHYCIVGRSDAVSGSDDRVEPINVSFGVYSQIRGAP